MYKKGADGPILRQGPTKGTDVVMKGSTGMKKGGKVKESMMEKKMGKGMTKAMMQKKAKPKKMAYGGMAKMKKGGMCK